MKELLSLKRNLHGTGSVLFRWDPKGTFLATCGQNRRLHIFDRTGALVDEHTLPSPKPPLQLDWSHDGENLAVLQDSSSTLCLWNAHTHKLKPVDMASLKDPSFMAWSRASAHLAVGTLKGNLLIYNASTFKTAHIAGKHSKKITCGQWSLDNKLALASHDRMMTISDAQGDLLHQAKLKYDPYDLQFSAQKQDDTQAASESTVSINMGHQTILLYNVADPDNPVELAFQSKYGEIVRYHWFGDGYLMIGFSRGYLIAISTHMREIGEELQSLKMYESALTNVCYSPALNQLAVAGDDGVKVVDMAEWKELKADQVRFNQDEGDVDAMAWTADGQILTVSTTGGYVFNYLTSIPQLSAAHGHHMAFLSSLRSVQLFDAKADRDQDTALHTWDVAIEPTFLALSRSFLACGMNHHCWFYALDSHAAVQEKQYMSTVRALALNDRWAAVLCDGRVVVHTLLPTAAVQRANPTVDPATYDDRLFPAPDDASTITSLQLTDDYLIYCTSQGTLVHWYLDEAAAVNEHRHECAITSFYTSPEGTRLVFVDQNHRGYLYSPVDDSCVDIPSFPSSVDLVLFDPLDPNTFVAVDAKTGKSAVTFIFAPQTTKGPTVTKLTNTKLPFSFQPVLFYDGFLHGQKAGGGLSSLLISSHDALSVIQKGAKRTPEKLRQGLTQLLALNRLKAAWEIACVVKQREQMLLLARKACDQLDIDLALRVYREMRETAMVQALEEIRHIEDRQLLAGHICLLSGDYNRASQLFLTSSQPTQALQMRRDLLQWEQALKLATTVAPDQIPTIAREYAAQLEVKGEYAKSLENYQKSLTEAHPSQADCAINRQLSAGGIARMTLRLGDLQKGQQLAYDSGDANLMKECAQILEALKQSSDAADMYARAEQFEKACGLYLTTKNFAKAAPLMQRITTPKLHAQYGKAKESEGAYQEAVVAYTKAKDVESVIRLCLGPLNEPEKAFALARSSRHAGGASLIARWCIDHSDITSAVEFLFIAKRHAEAFTMARDKRCMDIYAKVLGESGTTEEYQQIAAYYETEAQDYGQAAHYYALLGHYPKALTLYLSTPQPTAAQLYAAIDVVRLAQADQGGELLVRQLHDFLIGDSDGVVKDLNFIFRLYLSIGEYGQAANTAVLIAQQEQQCGQYNAAHAILLNIAQELRAKKIAIPNELKKSLTLLHSYRLAKLHSQKGNHALAARMLLRVSKNISKFPTHTVPILTSTVIECQRAGLKRSAYEYASVLMRPEHRGLVDAKYRKPIEAFVRRPVMEEEEERQSACPFCGMAIPDSMLECVGCRNDIPMCAVSGCHMVKDDWAECPRCRWTVGYAAMKERLAGDGGCVMCGGVVKVEEVVRVEDVQAWMRAQEVEETIKVGGGGAEEVGPPVGKGGEDSLKGSPRDYQAAVDIEVKF